MKKVEKRLTPMLINTIKTATQKPPAIALMQQTGSRRLSTRIKPLPTPMTKTTTA